MSWSGVFVFDSAIYEGKQWRLIRDRVLGKGSYGLAVVAHDESDPSISMVVKEVSLGHCKDQKELAAIFGEIKILKSVRHPNVVQFIDSHFVEEQQMLYILMEFCEQGDLGERLSNHWCRRKPVMGATPDEVTSVVIQLLMALKHLHFEHRIIHRDLKPQNVFLTADGIVKLGDFGVSTVLNSSVDFAQTFCGSPYYLAPELCEEKPYNGKADLWSLGCIIYELLTHGEKAFKGRTLVALVQQIVHCQFTPIEEANRIKSGATHQSYPSELCQLVPMLLRKDPDARATISRLLRMPYLVANATRVLPPALLATEPYASQFRQSGGGARVGALGRLPVGMSGTYAPPGSTFDAVAGGGYSLASAQPLGFGSSNGAAGPPARRTPPPAPSAATGGGSITLTQASMWQAVGRPSMGSSSAAAAPTDDATPYDDDEFDEELTDDQEKELESKVYQSWSVRDKQGGGGNMRS